MDLFVRSFSEPDELIEFEAGRSALISRGGFTVALDVSEPGWRWSTHVRPLVKTDWCEVRHVGVLLRGRLHFLLSDGREADAGPLSLIEIPPGHDAWVIGDEPAESLLWTGAKDWLRPLDTLAERILTTIVFTDLVDSTGTAGRLGRAAWGELLANHEHRERDIVARFRGWMVKTTGDGVLATFDGAARAVRCAMALRDSAVELGLDMRTCVHTGEVDLVDDDIRGMAIHEASRILGIATAGQVLVSDSTASLIGDASISLEDLGEHELRGIQSARRIYVVA